MDLLDHQNISEEKRRSLELAEESREKEWKYPSFALKLFHGVVDDGMLFPFPLQSPEEKARGDAYLEQLKQRLIQHLDPNEVDRTGEIPQKVIDALVELKALAIKIPAEYGGLGLGQVNYNRAIHLVASYCGSTAVFLSAHQSIGVPQPLKLFGTEEQKRKYLPRFAEGAVSAFALTEPEAGSDPRNMTTTATPVEGGRFYVLNGEKLWCTNGPIADVLIVMAVTPPKIVNGREKKQITAFIVETQWPGFEVVHRCRFMGLNGIQNGLIRFNNVKVPAENILGEIGGGLKLALTTLNTGRLTLPAACAGAAKWCLSVARRWAKERVQWGQPIGEHEAVALKLGAMAADVLAMEAVSYFAAALAEEPHKDIRLEAAMAKLFCSTRTWAIVDETMQIRGGQGYERSDSLKARGMPSWPVERVMRDLRINLIIEGTSEIMRLFIAREALDPHLSALSPLLKKGPLSKKLLPALCLTARYAAWYASSWSPFDGGSELEPPRLRRWHHYARATSRRLARELFHAMVRYGPALEGRQGVLNRLVDIGTELFALCATISYAAARQKDFGDNIVDLADAFAVRAAARIQHLFGELGKNHDKPLVKAAGALLRGDYHWLENDIIV